ncbi:hypothetical protein BDV3_005142 [Batrachochytrium dendrobatidis]|uniref:Uncharacterized protein n=1 Tax=Batrachochytrium dendrobatidis (strain JEL423) TaxID=403673 RepID=A0A177WLZ0_BATDL|nr:hypothetical protein BDEG_24391 [Batrachochytrium dendrobatidis JEL423]
MNTPLHSSQTSNELSLTLLDEFLDLVEALDDARMDSVTGGDASIIANGIYKMCSKSVIRRHCLAQTDLDVIDILAAFLSNCTAKNKRADRDWNNACELILQAIQSLVYIEKHALESNDILARTRPSIEDLISKKNSLTILRHTSGIVNLLGEVISIANEDVVGTSLVEISCQILSIIISNTNLACSHSSFEKLNLYYIPYAIWNSFGQLMRADLFVEHLRNQIVVLFKLWELFNAKDQADLFLGSLFCIANRDCILPSVSPTQLALEISEFLPDLIFTAKKVLSCKIQSLGKEHGERFAFVMESTRKVVRHTLQFLINLIFTRVKGAHQSKLLQVVHSELLDTYFTLRSKAVHMVVAQTSGDDHCVQLPSAHIYYTTSFDIKQSLKEIHTILIYGALDNTEISLNFALGVDYLLALLLELNPVSDSTKECQEFKKWMHLSCENKSEANLQKFLVVAEFVFEYYFKLITLHRNLPTLISDDNLRKGVQTMCRLSARLCFQAGNFSNRVSLESENTVLKNVERTKYTDQLQAKVVYLAQRHTRTWLTTCLSRPSMWIFLTDAIEMLSSSELHLAIKESKHLSKSTQHKHIDHLEMTIENKLNPNTKSKVRLHESVLSTPSVLSSFGSFNTLPPIVSADILHLKSAPTKTTHIHALNDTPQNTTDQHGFIPRPKIYYEKILSEIVSLVKHILGTHVLPQKQSLRPKSANVFCKTATLIGTNNEMNIQSDVDLCQSTKSTAHMSDTGLIHSPKSIVVELGWFLENDVLTVLPRLQSILVRVPNELESAAHSIQSLVFALISARSSLHISPSSAKIPDVIVPKIHSTRSIEIPLHPITKVSRLQPIMPTVGSYIHVGVLDRDGLTNRARISPVVAKPAYSEYMQRFIPQPTLGSTIN